MLCAIVQSKLLCNWTIVNSKLLCKSTVLHASEYKKNNSIDNQTDSHYFIMVNSMKTFS